MILKSLATGCHVLCGKPLGMSFKETAQVCRAAKVKEFQKKGGLDVVARCRAFGKTDHLFAINDKREFGAYVGPHDLVMEDGLPSETTLSLARKSGFVYDLIAGQAVPAITSRGQRPRCPGLADVEETAAGQHRAGSMLITESRFHFHFVSFSILPSRQVMPTLELTGDVKCAVLNCIMKRPPFTP